MPLRVIPLALMLLLPCLAPAQEAGTASEMTAAEFDGKAKELSLSAKELEEAVSAIRNHPKGNLIHLDETGIFPPFVTNDPARAREELELELMRRQSAGADGWEYAGPYGAVGEPRFIVSRRVDKSTDTKLFGKDVVSKSNLALVRQKQPDGSWNYGYVDYAGKVVIPAEYPIAGHFGEFPVAIVRNPNEDTLVFNSDGLLFQMFPRGQKAEIRGPFRKMDGGSLFEVFAPLVKGAHLYQWVMTPKSVYLRDGGEDTSVDLDASAPGAGAGGKPTPAAMMAEAASAAAGKTTIRDFNLAYLKALRALMEKVEPAPDEVRQEGKGDMIQRMREGLYKDN